MNNTWNLRHKKEHGVKGKIKRKRKKNVSLDSQNAK